jgi:hypothetical protein
MPFTTPRMCQRLLWVLGDVAEAQGVELRDGACAHGEDVAVDAAHTGGRALVGFDGAGVVVALDLEGTGPTIADVHQARVLLPASASSFGPERGRVFSRRMEFLYEQCSLHMAL